MQELARVMTQNGSVYVCEKEDGSLVEISYAPYGSERRDVACITHTGDTVKSGRMAATTPEPESLCEEFVTCDEITGYVGAWLEADTSDIPVEAVKHLQEACSICSKELEKPLEDNALEKFKDDIEPIPVTCMNGNTIVKTKRGTLRTCSCGDKNYPGIWVTYTPDGATEEIDIACIEQPNESDSVSLYFYGDPNCDDWTQKSEISLSAIEHIPSSLNGSLLREGIAVNTGEYEFGTLIPMYHGSGIVIGEFSQDRMNCGAMGEGVYFTSVFEEACDYAIDALDIEVATGKYLWNGKVYGYGCLCEELENRGYVKSYYLLVEDEDDITHSKYGNNGVIAVVRDVRQIFPIR